MIVMHVDANSAYLSWTAAWHLKNGKTVDLRTIPAVIAGNPQSRHGIILAKSIPAKKYGISTGMSLFEARKKCPGLAVFPPDFDLYMEYSQKMYRLLAEYTPQIQRYSIDECFLDYTLSRQIFGDPLGAAYEIKNRIREELGFTVNIGVSSNKLLAKMAGELEKPDKVHTLYPDEIKKKMWPLPVEDLFMVGPATKRKLREAGIRTIGELAGAKPAYLQALLKSHGQLIWNYANGIDPSPVIPNGQIPQKGIGNGVTTTRDVVQPKEAYMVLLSLTERVAMRMRRMGVVASLVCVSVKTAGFTKYSHQIKLKGSVNTTSEMYRYACLLFNQCWKGEALRQITVSVSDFSSKDNYQISLFDNRDRQKEERLDQAVDIIRRKYGERAVIRGSFAGGEMDPVQGGTNDGNFIMMGGK